MQERMTAAEYRELVQKGKRHKYNAQRTEVDGIMFDSKAEALYYQELLLLKRAGEVIDIQLQPRFILQDSFTKNGKKYPKVEYVADFLVTYGDGRQEVIDVKGFKTPVYKLKRAWFEGKYPELTIKEV